MAARPWPITACPATRWYSIGSAPWWATPTRSACWATARWRRPARASRPPSSRSSSCSARRRSRPPPSTCSRRSAPTPSTPTGAAPRSTRCTWKPPPPAGGSATCAASPAPSPAALPRSSATSSPTGSSACPADRLGRAGRERRPRPGPHPRLPGDDGLVPQPLAVAPVHLHHGRLLTRRQRQEPAARSPLRQRGPEGLAIQLDDVHGPHLGVAPPPGPGDARIDALAFDDGPRRGPAPGRLGDQGMQPLGPGDQPGDQAVGGLLPGRIERVQEVRAAILLQQARQVVDVHHLLQAEPPDQLAGAGRLADARAPAEGYQGHLAGA